MSEGIFTGKGKLFDVLRKLVKETTGPDTALVCFEDYEETRQAVKDIAEKGITEILIFSPLIMKQSVEIKEVADELRVQILIGAPITHYEDLGTKEAYTVYSGEKGVYEALNDVVEALGEHKYLGENIVEAPMMNYTAIGAHYGYLLSFYAGLGMCKRYGFPVPTYLYYTLDSLPPISEGAYRNVWGDFASPSDFHEFDDVIHAGEMLVRDMKKNSSIDDVYQNEERKLLIQKTLEKHWNDLMGDFAALSDKEEV